MVVFLETNDVPQPGIASNHGDPEHLWAQLGLACAMDGFRKAVKAAIGEKQETTGKVLDIQPVLLSGVSKRAPGWLCYFFNR